MYSLGDVAIVAFVAFVFGMLFERAGIKLHERHEKKVQAQREEQLAGDKRQ